MVTFIILGIAFVALGITFFLGKGSFLIAGYNTLDQQEKAKYSEKRLMKCMSAFCFSMTVMFGVCACLDDVMTTVVLVLSVTIVLTIILVIVANTFCRNRPL